MVNNFAEVQQCMQIGQLCDGEGEKLYREGEENGS